MTLDAARVQGLSKAYGGVTAVDDVTFEVEAGEIFGFLGPNGAGKTTTLECLETLRRPDRGVVRVLGLDPDHDGAALRARIGVQLQRAAFPARMRVDEAFHLCARLYGVPDDWRRLLSAVGLGDRHDVALGALSDGQRRRTFVALALVNRPELLFLDEPTASLDPHGRRAIWNLVLAARDRGASVIMATHCMEEAERLCDRVVVMVGGRIVAHDSPAALVRRWGGRRRIVLTVETVCDASPLLQVRGVERVEQSGSRIVVHGSDVAVADVIDRVTALGGRCGDLRTEEATLEDVVLRLTEDVGADREEAVACGDS